MADSTPVPDRRPLIYGLMAIVILLAATVLFWPSAEDEGTPTMVLTPESLQIVSESSPTANSGTTETGSEGAITAQDLSPEPLPLGETDIVDAPSSPASGMRVEGIPADPQDQRRPPRPLPLPTTANPQSPSSTMTDRPDDEGEYVLNVGSFRDRSNADRLVLDLQHKGVPAHVRAADSAGNRVYRVQVGYFASSGRAASYAEELKQRLGISAWTSRR